MRRLTLALLGSLLLLPAPARAWGFETHRFIVSRAIDLLPPEIRPFFEANRSFIVERAIDPDLWRVAGFTDEPPRHFLDMDAYGAYPFKELPRDYDAAVRKYGTEMLARNGLLPWRTSEIAGNLMRGFQAVSKNGAYAYSDIRFFSAIIGHYTADAHVPLHAVVNYDGQLTGQRGVHNRFEEELFVRYKDRLSFAPGPLKRITNERDFIFDTLLESSQLVPQVLAADKDAIGNGDLYDDRYFDAFFTKIKPVLEKRISDAITGVASIITSAWEQAGRPAIPAEPAQRAPQRRRVEP